ncbi:glycosyl hydrolase [Sphingobacterium chuzhouense]|uniref:Glycoside hydrolase n=1 Tax=Sphingobacterium chuzhouense TaxID=1742264 RepID=A0ABR7XMU5_9SPHI|nr:glycosyl hydrolase [Sphingobacterium chuzhouense]MBD1420489.1 glycoside hydrolase [Sphingobacterium chuzhouense]
MMKRRFLAILICYGMATSTGWAQDLWPSVTKEMKPWTRWWWLGSAVDKPNLSREIKLLYEAGFGGVEVTPIYGAKGYEDRYIPFLSEKWMDMLAFTADQADAHQMGVDINLGTGWPFGGPQIDEQHAATKLFLDEIDLKRGQALTFPLGVSDTKQSFSKLQALRAFKSNGEEIDLDNQMRNQSGSWTAPEDVQVIALFSGRTRQKVKRAAPGGEGFTLDHLGKEPVQRYFHHFQKAFQGKDLQIRAFFNDSYEVYGANWTDSFLEEFEKRKGYKLQAYLLDFAGKGNDKEREKRVKSDYREVVNAILRDNFLIPFTSFSNQHGALSKNQAHGSPGNLIDLYASTDIAECETFGSSFFAIPDLRRDSTDVRNVDPDPMMFKFASSATHTTGKQYTSSETFTWLTEHFKTSLAQAKPEVEQLFLAGVNHVFYHGTTYSPEDVPYPGWLFYASVNFTTNNSFWSHLPGLNSYITRVQSILQTTQADNELLVYWPIYDVWHDTKAPFKTLSVHHVDDWLHPTEFYKQSMYLQRLGYSFDFVTDAILAKSEVKDNLVVTAQEARPYKVIYIPSTQYFSEKTLENLLTLARNGATLIFETLPKDVDGLANLESRRKKMKELLETLPFKDDEENQYTKYGKGKVYLTNDIYSALETEQLYAERLARTGLKFNRRVTENGTYYYMVNHTDKMVDQYVQLNSTGKNYTLLDPQTGKTFKLPTEKDAVRVQIPSGYAWIVYVSDTDKTDVTYHYIDQSQEEKGFVHPWRVSFLNGGPQLPKARTLNNLGYWTDWGDEVANKFSGEAAYETSFSITKQADKAYQLQLGAVGESARVWVNGKDAGIVWAHPFTLEIGDLLQNGKNEIRIEVANLMANRVRDLDKRKVSWRNYHEINFVNIDYKDFDASQWKLMDSGLKGPVKLISY